MNPEAPEVRIAAVADIHCSKASKGMLQPLFTEASAVADVLCLCGDLTDYGHVDEAQVLAEELKHHVKVPILAVLGNHDFETGHAEEVSHILKEAGVHVLDGECIEIGGVGFAGTCGFGGGFGRNMLNAWGEPATKGFVQEAVDHAMRLERALARLETPQRVVLLHYAPIRDTVEGENPEVFPFLGCTRLEGPLNRYQVAMAFHGHAHRGKLEGRTSAGVPVYNVALPLLKAEKEGAIGFKLLTVRAGGS
jgi:Icc-related predicted phosphoesterase